MKSSDFRQHVIRPTLTEIGLWSEAAEILLLGTALIESRLYNLVQIQGPAVGIFQIEPRTHDDIWENYLKFRDDLHSKILALRAPVPTAHEQLITNLGYAAAMARLVYRRSPDPLPEPDDYAAMGRYWKKIYNTHLGSGDARKFTKELRGELGV